MGATNTESLVFVRTLEAPAQGSSIAEAHTAYDGRLVLIWQNAEGARTQCQVYKKNGSCESISFSAFPGHVSFVMPMPGNRWLGCKARTWYEEGKPLADSAWIVSEQGKVLSSGNMGDALSCPTVAQDETIWAPYFDEHPGRDEGPVDESSDYGKYTAGDSGMTVFDDHLKVLGRHNSPTYVMDVYYSHHDGYRYWYLSYPDWIIDNWSASGQGEPMAADDELELRGAPFLMYKNRLARLSVFESE
ncbi:hypothetical protein [Xylocopilactobacillus apis]|uniref:Uncharacterized protein n=1 Tax=Xylocopilactobacillus apis TaxID=2932183 RepID=A0AAU9CP66_9LACO|nr:hypothetical protein [Xylocopilactobacillus apis]BDR55739.1 hypothetical protein KIMC2_03010 [Xylocopilactobacillus apis]